MDVGNIADREAAPPSQRAPRAGGATVLGEVTTVNHACALPVSPPLGVVSEIEDPARPSYIAPFSGVLTSYSTSANGAAGNVRLLVLKAGADATHKVLTATSAQHVVIPSSLNTVPVRLSIQAGERIGLGLSSTNLDCLVITSSADEMGYAGSFDADASTDFAYSGTVFTGVRPNVSAVLEPDADGDLHGDVSQDLCPQSALAQVACPAPDTIITKAPKKSSTKRKATITFTAGVPASFTCAVDGAPATACTSPFKKKFKYGKHVVVITATSPYGTADPTPAAVRFKVKRPR